LCLLWGLQQAVLKLGSPYRSLIIPQAKPFVKNFFQKKLRYFAQ
jgi:hypothetical protein